MQSSPAPARGRGHPVACILPLPGPRAGGGCFREGSHLNCDRGRHSEMRRQQISKSVTWERAGSMARKSAFSETRAG